MQCNHVGYIRIMLRHTILQSGVECIPKLEVPSLMGTQRTMYCIKPISVTKKKNGYKPFTLWTIWIYSFWTNWNLLDKVDYLALNLTFHHFLKLRYKPISKSWDEVWEMILCINGICFYFILTRRSSTLSSIVKMLYINIFHILLIIVYKYISHKTILA
jgi:hypothetical protein